MEAMEPMVHNSNKRFRQSQDSSFATASPYGQTGTHQSYQGPALLSNNRSGSSDQSTGSDQGPHSMTRSVSESSLGLSAPDSRSTTGLQTYQGGYPNSDPQQHLMLQNHPSGMPMSHSPHPNHIHTNSMLPFQESSGRGPPPPQHLNNAFLLNNHPGQGMNGCIPSGGHMNSSPLTGSSLVNSPMINGHLAAAGSTFSGANSSYSSQPNNSNNNNNGMMQHNAVMPHNQGGMTFQPVAPSIPPGSMTSVVQSAFVQSPLPSVVPVPKWENPVSKSSPTAANSGTAGPTPPLLEPPCAACKSLRRKCTRDCIFLPYFPRDDPDKFARVHKVFGASNVAKMLQDLPVHQREDTVASLEYEAQARVQDPVFGCVGILCLLQKQIAMLQNQVAELQVQQGVNPRPAMQDGMQANSGGNAPQGQGGNGMGPH